MLEPYMTGSAPVAVGTTVLAAAFAMARSRLLRGIARRRLHFLDLLGVPLGVRAQEEHALVGVDLADRQAGHAVGPQVGGAAGERQCLRPGRLERLDQRCLAAERALRDERL